MSKRTLSGTYVPANPEPPKRLCPGEVILYKIPPAEHTLFVCRLHPDTTEEELEEAFSPFGLLYEVRCYMRDGDGGGESSQASQATPGPSASQEPSPTLLNKFAFVRFYSYFSALTAKQDVNDRKFHGARCKVTFSKLKGEDKYGGSNALPLTMRRSTELTNYYFGYDGWSSRLVALAPETPVASLVPDPKTRLYKCVYKCVIHLSFHTQDRELEALGFGEEESDSKGTAIEYAKKKAVTEAYKNAFGSLALVVLRGGRVALHFLDTSVDLWDAPVPGEAPSSAGADAAAFASVSTS